LVEVVGALSAAVEEAALSSEGPLIPVAHQSVVPLSKYLEMNKHLQQQAALNSSAQGSEQASATEEAATSHSGSSGQGDGESQQIRDSSTDVRQPPAANIPVALSRMAIKRITTQASKKVRCHITLAGWCTQATV
jgi:hypothetical protein